MTGAETDAYGEELARISRHQSEAVTARLRLFEVLAAAGVTAQEADALVSRLEAGAVAGAHTWVSESSPPHGAEQLFEDGWFAGVRAVSSYLLRIADDAAAQQGRAATSAGLLAHLRRPAPVAAAPVPQPAAAGEVPPPDPDEVLAAALRCTWALASPEGFFVPEASREILAVALAAVGEGERDGYVQRLEAFADRHRERLAELVRAYGPGSAPAAYGRYALVGQPEALVIYERMENARQLLYGLWDGELEDTYLADLAFVWGVRGPTP